MDESEKKLKQEDCNEDSLGAGILTLTTKRIAFDKTRGRIADFTKRIDETILDAPLENVVKAWKEGLLMKKVCIRVKTEQGEKDYKFGVFSNGGWLKDIQKALGNIKTQ